MLKEKTTNILLGYMQCYFHKSLINKKFIQEFRFGLTSTLLPDLAGSKDIIHINQYNRRNNKFTLNRGNTIASSATELKCRK